MQLKGFKYFQESFKSLMQFRKIEDDEDYKKYMFGEGKNIYGFVAEYYNGVWQISFHLIKPYGNEKLTMDDIKRSNYDAKLDMTGTGNQFKVISTVLQIINEFVKQENPNKVSFIADKISLGQSDIKYSDARGSVYRKLVQRYLPKEYEVSEKETEDHVQFNIEKK